MHKLRGNLKHSADKQEKSKQQSLTQLSDEPAVVTVQQTQLLGRAFSFSRKFQLSCQAKVCC